MTRLTPIFIALGLLGCSMAGCSGPESVVMDAANAAADGDRDAYLACFTPRSRALIEAHWLIAEQVAPEQAKLVGGPVQIVGVAPAPDTYMGVSRRIIRVQEHAKQADLVLHGKLGAWRIDLPDTEQRMTRSAMPFPGGGR